MSCIEPNPFLHFLSHKRNTEFAKIIGTYWSNVSKIISDYLYEERKIVVNSQTNKSHFYHAKNVLARPNTWLSTINISLQHPLSKCAFTIIWRPSCTTSCQWLNSTNYLIGIFDFLPKILIMFLLSLVHFNC